jgi:hypothetical protein
LIKIDCGESWRAFPESTLELKEDQPGEKLLLDNKSISVIIISIIDIVNIA